MNTHDETMDLHHETISNEKDIPDLCKALFFTKEKLYGMAWILASIFVLGYGAAVAYAIGTSVSITKLESEININKKNIEYLNDQINKKLDILISKTDN